FSKPHPNLKPQILYQVSKNRFTAKLARFEKANHARSFQGDSRSHMRKWLFSTMQRAQAL
ncbi:hypothetical protein PLA106_15218, partial [Pseudomonas amygdali pv. lachrymans str. M302278]